MALTHRVERVAEQVREEVSLILATEVADPGVGLVTVSRVKVTPDLSLARIYWTLLGGPAEKKKTAQALQRAARFIRHLLAERLGLRRAPEVVFQYDEGLAAHTRVEEILHELHEQEAARAQATPEAAEAVADAPADTAAPAAPSTDDDTPRS